MTIMRDAKKWCCRSIDYLYTQCTHLFVCELKVQTQGEKETRETNESASIDKKTSDLLRRDLREKQVKRECFLEM